MENYSLLFGPSIHNVCWGQTTRKGGVSQAPFGTLNLARHVGDRPEDVGANWEIFSRLSSIDRSSIATCSQVHGADILLVDEGGHYNFAADALISMTPGVAVGVFTADCVPILMSTRQGNGVAAIHCGWRGAALGLASKVLQRLIQVTGCEISQVDIWIGASISQTNYEVGPEVATQFSSSNLLGKANQKFLLDVAGAVRRELIDNGVAPSTIQGLEVDTFSNPDLFYSYRRDGAQTGRMLSFVQRTAL